MNVCTKRGVSFWAAVALMHALYWTIDCRGQAQEPQREAPGVKLFMIPNTERIEEQRMDPALGASEVSVLQPHSIVVWLVEPPLDVRQVKITLVDANGNLVEKVEAPFVHQPNQRTYFGQYPIAPDHNKHVAGRWKISCEIVGWTRAQAEYVTIPATPDGVNAVDEKREDFYKAGESVLNAMAHYWGAATNETYVCIIGSAGGRTGESRWVLTDFRRLAGSIKLSRDPVSRYIGEKLPDYLRQKIMRWDDAVELPEGLEAEFREAFESLMRRGLIWDYSRFPGFEIPDETRKLAASDPKGDDLLRVNREFLLAAYPATRGSSAGNELLQVKFLDTGHMAKVAISDADELNGIAFRGRVSMSFGVFRTFDPVARTWSKWKDVRPRDEEGRPKELMRNLLGPMYPEGWKDWVLGVVDPSAEAPGVTKWRELVPLDFRVEKRDGNWFVEAVHGPGANGATRSDGYWHLVPYATFVNGKQRAEDTQKAVRPSHSLLAAVNAVDPARLADAKLGQEVRDSPEQVTADMNATMEALRGRKRY